MDLFVRYVPLEGDQRRVEVSTNGRDWVEVAVILAQSDPQEIIVWPECNRQIEVAYG